MVPEPQQRLEVGQPVPAVLSAQATKPRRALIEEVVVDYRRRDLYRDTRNRERHDRRSWVLHGWRPRPAPTVVAGDQVAHQVEVFRPSTQLGARVSNASEISSCRKPAGQLLRC